MKKVNHKSGFTLVELIVVIVIILILAAVLVPNVFKYISTAGKASCAETRHSLATELLLEYISNDEMPETDGTVVIPEALKHYKCPSGGTYTAEYENGAVVIFCSKHDGDGTGGTGGYKPVKVNASVEKYGETLNVLLKTLYDSLVADRLKDDKNHISHVLFNGGKVSKVYVYNDENHAKGNTRLYPTDTELKELNNKISQALAKTDYKVAGNQAGYIFFDWEGNVITGRDEAGNALGIAGQGTGSEIKLSSPAGDNMDSAIIKYDDTAIGWTNKY